MPVSARPVDKESLEHYLAASSHSPTAMRLVLGNLLRKMRKQAGIEAEAAGRHIGGSEAKISRLERGNVACKEPDVMDLLALYGVCDEQVLACFAQMVDLSRRSGWWQRYDGVLPDWFGKLIGLQEAASVIRTYEVQLVPGLLQTADYARAVTRLGYPVAAQEEIDARVELRMDRRALLTRSEPPHLWAILDEAALSRPVGGEQVMRAQIGHLVDMARLPNVRVQIAPLSEPRCAVAGFPITHLRFDLPDLPDIIYLEQLGNADYLDKPEQVEHYRSVLDTLSMASLSPKESFHLLENARRY
ncbi:helix-turn-helix domain-containing protein [Streptomyces sp. 110]|uniref:Helix-turn-helix domain-containing protein n=1 Tax=Streptomyces endocoffeicus TaxID=2898945 RepID=A0ABS1Q7F2_9ACTN|nr:helix-turn-helix transcriptional regulator [Streptomyces endocoffeicus]MBL1120479.1 helix-turn-helix domain-containing protein [Streptomyces endocoffeicus]